MNAPAISRYGATAPELLRWFDGFNAKRLYRDQVKPFGFLLSLSAKRNWKGEEVIAPKSRKGRPPKVQPPKPVAPFDTDPAKIAATAFDRESGKPVPATALQTYVEALVQYHLHPESKFLGGDYRETGTTRRRHIRASGIRHIGKEANEWERQAMLGINGELNPDYGLSEDSLVQLLRELANLAATMGAGEAANALRIAPSRLRSILVGKLPPNGETVRILAARLPLATRRAENLCEVRANELQRLRELVQLHGLRGAARLLGIDPSNLRRKLKSPI